MDLVKVKFDDILKYIQPSKYIVESTNYSDEYKTPVLTAGQSFILGYTNEEKGIFNEVPVIIFDDFTTAIKYVDFPFKVKSSAMKILKPRTENIDIKYIFYKMSTIKINSNEHKRYWISKYSQIQIPLPPLPTQQKIAAILDAADSYRQHTKTLIEKYDQLAQVLFIDMFGDPVKNEKGWEIRRLEDVCNKITDGTHQSPKFISEGIPFLFVSNIVNNQIDYNTKKFISDEEYKKLTKSTSIEINDILYTSVGSYGNPAIVKENRKFCFQRHIAHLKPDHSLINSNFLHSMLLSPMVKHQTDVIARGVAQKTMNLREIKSINIYFPPLQIQNLFAERIQHIEAQKQQAQSALQHAEQLFQSLLQRAFKGQLG